MASNKPTEEVNLPDPPKEYVELLVKHPFSVRTISKEDWARAGIEHDSVTWSVENGYRVPVESLKLDSDQFARYISNDPGLRVVEAQE